MNGRIRKPVYILISIALLINMCACGSKPASEVSSANTVDTGDNIIILEDNPVPEETVSEEEAMEEKIEAEKEEENIPVPDPESGVDIDLTEMSSTMVYSEVYDMVYYPEKYIGKTVKMDGLFASYHDEATGNDYYACIIQDATACCSQGIEFDPAGKYVFPDDFPDEGGPVTVVGVFDTYMEGENKFCTLREAKMLTV